MIDHEDPRPTDSEPSAPSQSAGVWLLVLVFGVPLALVFLAQWLVF